VSTKFDDSFNVLIESVRVNDKLVVYKFYELLLHYDQLFPRDSSNFPKGRDFESSIICKLEG